MKTKLKLALETAIESVIEKSCEKDLWSDENYIHSNLYLQMTEAAERVFDAAMDAQEFARQEAQ